MRGVAVAERGHRPLRVRTRGGALRVSEVTPVVQALPPSVLVADVSGSLRYFDRDPSSLTRMIRTPGRSPATAWT